MRYNKKHGLSGTRLYRIYTNMLHRCYDENSTSYPNYGGRGISVCKTRKNDVKSFFKWALANGYKDGLTLERKDVNKDYKPSNCTWATMREQQNNRTNNLLLTINGETHTVMEWSRITGVPRTTIQNRHYAGKTGEDLIRKRGQIKVQNLSQLSGHKQRWLECERHQP